jgi:signal transduction histidine kinase
VRVATRLAAAFALHIAVLTVLLVHHVRTIRETVAIGYELTEISSRVYRTATEQVGRIVQLEENAAKHLVTRDTGYLAKFEELAREYSRDLDALQQQPLSDREREHATALAAEWQAFGSYARRLAVLSSEPDSAGAVAGLQNRLVALRMQTQRMSEASHEAMLGQLARSGEAARRAERLSWIAAGLALILSVFVSVMIVRSIGDGLNRLTAGTREVARGRFGYRLDTSRQDEFAQVARDFNIMTERLDELDRMKRDFISKVSHDLKTPLASMQETIVALLDEVPGPIGPRQRRLLELNHQSGQRLYGMLGKLLDLSRLEAGAVEPQLEEIDVAELIEDVAESHSRPGAEIGVQLAAAPLLLTCDRDRVLQLLQNLVENAVKFATPGNVRVAAAPGGDGTLSGGNGSNGAARATAGARAGVTASAAGVHIVVSDDGPGVPDGEKERVFERFYQGTAGQAVRGRGVGLGLTICREIVTVHGGSIWIADRAGGGSEFHVLLPERIRDTASVPATAGALSPGHRAS